MSQYNILCTPDNNYIPYCGIMLTSLFENNKDLDICVYVMCEHLEEKSIANLKRLSEHYNADINIITVNSATFKECPIRTGDHVSIAAYYRLIVSDILPKHLDKILYLDCDIIVNASIKELYNYNIERYALGAVIDESFFEDSKYERLCYEKQYPYINSGVILFNLNYWRNNRVVDKCLDYISKNPDKVKLHDQDTINALLHKEISLLPIKYNFQTGFLLTRHIEFYEKMMSEILQTTKSPMIIHYTGPNKPWFRDCRHPFRKRFLHYKSISLWKKYPAEGNWKNLTDVKNRIIWGIGLKKRPKTFIIKTQD